MMNYEDGSAHNGVRQSQAEEAPATRSCRLDIWWCRGASSEYGLEAPDSASLNMRAEGQGRHYGSTVWHENLDYPCIE